MSKSNLHWRSYVQPGRIFGNLYFVGTYAASSHIIDTGEGLIMIDTGYAEGAYLILHNIWDLGFCPYDIKYIIHSHGHYDHVGATCAIAKLTGAKTAISRIDAPMVDGTLVKTYHGGKFRNYGAENGGILLQLGCGNQGEKFT